MGVPATLLKEAERAGEMERWTATLLFSAVDKIAERRGREF
mgnify:CR=1 FL=1